MYWHANLQWKIVSIVFSCDYGAFNYNFKYIIYKYF